MFVSCSFFRASWLHKISFGGYTYTFVTFFFFIFHLFLNEQLQVKFLLA